MLGIRDMNNIRMVVHLMYCTGEWHVLERLAQCDAAGLRKCFFEGVPPSC